MFSFSNNLTVKPSGNLAALVLTIFASLLFFGCGGGGYNGGSPTVVTTYYTVIFLDENDVEIANLSKEMGSNITIPEAPEKKGYLFDGWIEVAGAQMIGKDETSYIVTGDVTFKAQYIEVFRVAFFDEKLDLLKEENIIRGDSVDLDNKTLEYAKSWHLSHNTSVASGNFTPEGNINFYATSDVIEILNETKLDDIGDNLSGKYILTSDIKLQVGENGVSETQGWTPVGSSPDPFKGILNGDGHTISNFWINRVSSYPVGLFGYVSGGTIKNVGILIDENRSVRGGNYVGGIAGELMGNSTITNSYVKGNVTGGAEVGGIVGYIGNSTINNSYFIGNVRGSTNVGAIAGHVRNNSTIEGSYSAGKVGTSSYIGAIAGIVDGGSTITNNAAINQELNATSHFNRIVGYVSGTYTVSNNFALETMSVNGAPKNSDDTDGLDGADKTNDELKTQTTYEDDLGWDFATIWKIDEGEGYPYLYWEDR
ncbi:MAG: InlB B-repeat-containing protein [Campylobacteraceae bacterium]|jgi:hypothetical protein|nr:InlB B-repeat-containing protein [Campylobacteraceae bacterium]